MRLEVLGQRGHIEGLARSGDEPKSPGILLIPVGKGAAGALRNHASGQSFASWKIVPAERCGAGSLRQSGARGGHCGVCANPVFWISGRVVVRLPQRTTNEMPPQMEAARETHLFMRPTLKMILKKSAVLGLSAVSRPRNRPVYWLPYAETLDAFRARETTAGARPGEFIELNVEDHLRVRLAHILCHRGTVLCALGGHNRRELVFWRMRLRTFGIAS